MKTRIRRAEIVATAARASQLPPPNPEWHEVALLGRSNVGKSSLLNKLANRKKLARTSATPGKTRLVHFFEIRRTADRLLFVDLPGYGFAKVSKQERRSWRRLVESYLTDRGPLRCAVLLQDARRDPREDELDLIAWLAEQRIPVLVAVTKCDKLGSSERAARVRAIARALDMPDEAVVPTSASKGLGMPALWGAIDAALSG